MRRVAIVALAPFALSACSSTQTRSARLRAAAANRPDAKPFIVTKANPNIRFGRMTVLQDENGTAVVVPVRSRARRPLADVPLSFTVRDRNGARLYRNDLPGLDASLISAAVVSRGRPLLWVNDQVRVAGSPARVSAKAGDAEPVPRPVPRLALRGVRYVDDPTEGLSVKGAVSNRSSVLQRRLVVYVVGRRGARVTAAGRAIVPRLKPGRTARFTAFLIGDATDARITAAAPPTTLAKPKADR